MVSVNLDNSMIEHVDVTFASIFNVKSVCLFYCFYVAHSNLVLFSHVYLCLQMSRVCRAQG